MKFAILFVGMIIQLSSFSQTSKYPIEVTPELQKKIKLDIDKMIPQLKRELESQKENSIQIEFSLDTFCVERFMEKWTDIDFTDAGISEGTYAGAKLYDSLLNKYYKKLMAVLKGDDKKILVQAQRSWISFRDSESSLIDTISKDEYSGGGTMQKLTDSSEYLDLIKTRTLMIFSHYTRAMKVY